MFLLDSHIDTPTELFRGRDISIDNSVGHVDIPKLKRGGVDGAFFALYISAELDNAPDKAYEYANSLYEKLKTAVEHNRDEISFACTKEQGLKNKENGKISAFIGLENGSPVGESLERIQDFYDKGIRYITLCHSGNNQICDSCASTEKKWHGLSPFGREVVAEMNRLGMLVDVSHISDEAFYDVLKYSSKPVVATHSCCRALADHPRNMTDDMIRALAAAGGVIQINFYPLFLDGIEEPACSYKRIADHIDHVMELVGIEHVGLGSDFDGIDVTPEGLDDISMFPKVIEELRNRRYSESDIEKITSENIFRIL